MRRVSVKNMKTRSWVAKRNVKVTLWVSLIQGDKMGWACGIWNEYRRQMERTRDREARMEDQ